VAHPRRRHSADLNQFGYAQSLRRTLGPYGSFAIAFSMVSITTAIFFLLPSLFGTAVALATVFASDIWANPTHGDIVLFATVAMAAAGLINIISIKAVSAVNNTGVFFEITGSVVAAALLFFGAIFFFRHDAGFSILVSTKRTSGGALWYGFVLAALLPLYCFIGWEGAADLAEETRDPRSVTPFAMIRANYVSVAASLFMIIGFLIAIPDGIGNLLGQSKNPLVYIFQSHFGVVAADILQVVVFLAIFSCVLANMVVATRLTFALSRDKMLPASSLLGRVNTSTRTPVDSIVVVAVIGIAINMLSAGIAANVVSICSVAYYFVYALTVGGAMYAHVKRRIPAHRRGDFSLGRWFPVVAIAALVYAAGVIVIALAPHEGHIAAVYLAGAEVVGVAWYLLYLRPRIANRTVGAAREQAAEPEEPAATVA
jgi:amino acid transporter